MNNKFFVNKENNTTNSKIIKKDKSNTFENIFNIFKVIFPQVAVILMLVFANFIGLINIEFNSNGTNEKTISVEENTDISNKILTDIPRIVEKSTFEKLLAKMMEKDTKETMHIYYCIKEFASGVFYVFDPIASDREITQIIGYWNNHISWDDIDYTKMFWNYQLIDIENELRRKSKPVRESIQNLSSIEFDLSEVSKQLETSSGSNPDE